MNDWADAAVARSALEFEPRDESISVEAIARGLVDSLGPEWRVETGVGPATLAVMLRRAGESRREETDKIRNLLISAGWRGGAAGDPAAMVDFHVFRRRGQVLFVGSGDTVEGVAYMLFMHGTGDAAVL